MKLIFLSSPKLFSEITQPAVKKESNLYNYLIHLGSFFLLDV
jgi:hypothetical protein